MSAKTPMSFVATSAPSLAKAFYSDVLGLDLVEQSPFALAFSDQGHLLRVQIVEGHDPAPYTVHGWQVTDIQEQVDHLKAKGITCLQFDQLTQDPAGIWTTPDHHKIAWFKDPSGNILSFTEYATA